jgi:hypothetical protein
MFPKQSYLWHLALVINWLLFDNLLDVQPIDWSSIMVMIGGPELEQRIEFLDKNLNWYYPIPQWILCHSGLSAANIGIWFLPSMRVVSGWPLPHFLNGRTDGDAWYLRVCAKTLRIKKEYTCKQCIEVLRENHRILIKDRIKQTFFKLF